MYFRAGKKLLDGEDVPLHVITCTNVEVSEYYNYSEQQAKTSKGAHTQSSPLEKGQDRIGSK